VIVQRWQTLAGKKAKLDGDGRTFDEIAKERLLGRGTALASPDARPEPRQQIHDPRNPWRNLDPTSTEAE